MKGCRSYVVIPGLAGHCGECLESKQKANLKFGEAAPLKEGNQGRTREDWRIKRRVKQR